MHIAAGKGKKENLTCSEILTIGCRHAVRNNMWKLTFQQNAHCYKMWTRCNITPAAWWMQCDSRFKTTGLVKLEDARKCNQCKFAFAWASNLKKHTMKEHNVCMRRCCCLVGFLLQSKLDPGQPAATLVHFYNCTESLLLVDSTFALKATVIHWCWRHKVVHSLCGGNRSVVSPACIPDSGYCLIGLVHRPAGRGFALLKVHIRVNTWVLGLCWHVNIY